MAKQLSSTGLFNDASLVSYWKFEDNLTDSKGSNNLTGGGSPTYAQAVFNKGIDFEYDSSQYATIADAAQTGLDITTSFSIVGWVKPESLAATFGMCGKDDLTDGYAVTIATTGQVNFVTRSLGTASTVSPTGAVGTGAWYHIAGVWDDDANTKVLYVNGSKVGESTGVTGTMAGNAAAFFVGCTRSTVNYADGMVDDLAIFSRALGSGEVKTLASGGRKVVAVL